ncbi:MAG: GTP-binding protein, partial [Clostridia bacterium]|nr:GTP-binding protein [Clostridia bacterium]
MTKIDIFSGFLGAGKTTLIKKLLKEAYTSEKVVLIENEFGEIGIDGGFLKDAGVEITEMNSGCICCSLVGDFGEALRKVIADFAPDRILIEPSGVGKLSDVVKAVEGVCTDGIVLNGKVTVADASKCKVYMKNFGEFYNNQIENADTIILSRTSAISDEKLATALSLLREKNANATIITTPWEQLDGKTILNSIENTHTLEDELHKLEDEAHHEHHHHHDDECHCHDHEHHHHDHDDECHCHDHEHHHHDEECHCHDHEHHHDHDDE